LPDLQTFQLILKKITAKPAAATTAGAPSENGESSAPAEEEAALAERSSTLHLLVLKALGLYLDLFPEVRIDSPAYLFA